MTTPQKPPVLTPAEIDSAKQSFIAQIRRELVIEGLHDSPGAKQVLAELPSRIVVTSKFGGPEVRFANEHGGRVGVRDAVSEILGAVHHAEQLASFGPNPSVLLMERLQLLDFTREEASRYAGRVERQPDGRVAAWTPESGFNAFTPAPESGRAYTPAELEEIRSPLPALALATRAIVAERDKAAGITTMLADTSRRTAQMSSVAGVL